MVQIMYDGKEFYTRDLFTKKRKTMSVEQLPEEFDKGQRIFFDNGDNLTFTRSIKRDELVKECQRSYIISF